MRLKRDQINEMLMHYLRVKLDKLEDWREFELKCLEFYHSILLHPVSMTLVTMELVTMVSSSPCDINGSSRTAPCITNGRY